MGTQKRAREAHLLGWPPHLLQFPNPSWMFGHHTPHQTHMFGLWKVQPWSPALFSYTASLTLSPPTTQMHGLDSSDIIVFLTSTLACTIVSPMASILASLAYLNYIPLLITLPFINIQKPTTRLWRMNSGKGDTLGLSHRPSSRCSLDPSNCCPFPWLTSQANQENTEQFMTSPTPTYWAKTLSPPLIWPSAHMTSLVPGEPFPQYALSSISFPQAHKHPSGTYQLEAYCTIPANYQQWPPW